jgi:Prealbumin-like fold domain
MSKFTTRVLGVLFGVVLWAASAGSALAFTEGVFVGSTLQGCRNNQGSTPLITLPIGGLYKCPDTAYVTGNFSHWFELDLVPHRLTTTVGNQSTATTDYNVYIAGDGITSGKLGWDVITEPVVNAAKSDASCTVTAGPQLTLGTPTTPFGGGTDTVIYRQLTIHQNKGSTCVFDWVQRLALGSHLYPGSSLQSYLAVQEGLSGSKKTISIDVEKTQAQALNKDMTASQGTDHTWNLTKSPTTNLLPFGDVCAKDALTELPVQITVSWTKSAAIAGMITVTTNVYATNPANRVITTTVTDVIYSGTTLLDTTAPVTKDVPANTTNYLMLTHSITVAAGTTQLNDVATATYTDLVTGVDIPGSTTATASAPVQQTGPELNATAVITDLEQISGAGLTYSVAVPSLGGFLGYPLLTDPAYVAGTKTAGYVNWGTASQPGTGSVTFDKKVYLAGRTITTGTLMDSASLVGSSGYAATAGPVTINISSTSTATLTINKSYKGLTIGAGEKLVFNFHVSRNGDATYGADTSITLTGDGNPVQTSGSVSLAGLTPDTYSVLEGDTFFYPAGCNDASCRLTVSMTDPNGLLRTVHLETVNGIATCSGTAAYANEPNRTTFPTAQVKKATVPATSSGSWSFTLKRSDGTTAGTATATANATTPNSGYADFGVSLDEGTYTVVETEQPPQWVLTNASPNNGTDKKTCTFTVNLPNDQGKVFQCAFTNTEQGKARVVKTAKGQPLAGTTYAFSFELRQGASMTAQGTTLATGTANASNGGTIDFSPYLTPGAYYQICEVVMPGWSTNLAGDGQLFVPESIIPPSLPNPNVNNMTVCADFKVAEGQTRTFTVDNSPPPGGRALTIGFWKNWASCKKSGGGQQPVLDQTMAKAETTGIQVDSFYLHGSTATPNVAPDCAKAVNLLSKQNFKGVNKASDPLFNMAAQLVAAELNLVAGAYSCPAVVAAIGQANALLTKYSFNGTSYTGTLVVNAAANPPVNDPALANSLAKRLDDYNNNRASACQ